MSSLLTHLASASPSLSPHSSNGRGNIQVVVQLSFSEFQSGCPLYWIVWTLCETLDPQETLFFLKPPSFQAIQTAHVSPMPVILNSGGIFIFLLYLVILNSGGIYISSGELLENTEPKLHSQRWTLLIRDWTLKLVLLQSSPEESTVLSELPVSPPWLCRILTLLESHSIFHLNRELGKCYINITNIKWGLRFSKWVSHMWSAENSAWHIVFSKMLAILMRHESC